MRCLVDENMYVDIANALRERGHDVVHVAQSAMRGWHDEAIWKVAREEERILLTQDLDFPLRGAGSVPGVLILRYPQSFRRQNIAQLFTSFLDEGGLDAVPGNIVIVSPGRVRSRAIERL